MPLIALSIQTLLSQVNVYAPHRNRASDGTIGDARHQAEGSLSDHNPWYNNTVTAVDITHDPAGGWDGQWLADSLVSSGDPRIKYIIWNRFIYENRPGFQGSRRWVSYTGTDPHTSHVHLSVVASPLCNDPSSWKLWIFNVLQKGSWNPRVGQLQSALNTKNHAGLVVDTRFGPLTDTAVRAFQQSRHITVDGIAGPVTLGLLGV